MPTPNSEEILPNLVLCRGCRRPYDTRLAGTHALEAMLDGAP